MGRLQSLQELTLRSTKELKRLPEEIGNLGNLIKLDLMESRIESLPPLIEYSLVCSRFRNRAAMAAPASMIMGLPHLLGNARRYFRFHVFGMGDLGLEEPDAIYCILTNFRGPMVEAITSAHGVANQD